MWMMGRGNTLEGGSHDERVDAEAKADHVAIAVLRNRTLTPTPSPGGRGAQINKVRSSFLLASGEGGAKRRMRGAATHRKMAALMNASPRANQRKPPGFISAWCPYSYPHPNPSPGGRGA